MTAEVIVAVISGVAIVLAAVIPVQLKVHKDNRHDHAATAAEVKGMRADVTDIKSDVREVKADIRSHGERIRRLEDDPG